MEPITREEYYLAKIAGTWQGKTPEPVTIEEYYLATMTGDYSGNTPTCHKIAVLHGKGSRSMGREHPCACDTVGILLGGNRWERGSYT